MKIKNIMNISAARTLQISARINCVIGKQEGEMDGYGRCNLWKIKISETMCYSRGDNIRPEQFGESIIEVITRENDCFVQPGDCVFFDDVSFDNFTSHFVVGPEIKTVKISQLVVNMLKNFEPESSLHELAIQGISLVYGYQMAITRLTTLEHCSSSYRPCLQDIRALCERNSDLGMRYAEYLKMLAASFPSKNNTTTKILFKPTANSALSRKKTNCFDERNKSNSEFNQTSDSIPSSLGTSFNATFKNTSQNSDKSFNFDKDFSLSSQSQSQANASQFSIRSCDITALEKTKQFDTPEPVKRKLTHFDNSQAAGINQMSIENMRASAPNGSVVSDLSFFENPNDSEDKFSIFRDEQSANPQSFGRPNYCGKTRHSTQMDTSATPSINLGQFSQVFSHGQSTVISQQHQALSDDLQRSEFQSGHFPHSQSTSQKLLPTQIPTAIKAKQVYPSLYMDVQASQTSLPISERTTSSTSNDTFNCSCRLPNNVYGQKAHGEGCYFAV